MYYLIEHKYVGPNKMDAQGNFYQKSMTIQTTPGKANMSHEKRTKGWLGTTNDRSATAHGEFENLDEARKRATELGYTHILRGETEYISDEEEGFVEQYISEADARKQWDADAWFLHENSREAMCREYGITAESTDDELQRLTDSAEEDARSDGVELHGTYELFEELRDELRAEDD
ncbi:MAG: hypothetical protein ABSH41_19735 [Syntrophobacteraceae bacterium]